MPGDAPAGPAQAAELRRLVYRVLAELFRYPDDARIAMLVTAAPELRRRSEPLRSLPFSAAWEGLLTALEDLDDERIVPLQDEYTALFLAGARVRSCPPYASAHWPDGGVGAGSIAAEVERAYTEAGLVSLPHERPDHLAVELEFLSFLCGEEARERGAAAGIWLAREGSFLADHLLRWLPRFVEAIRETAPGSLYRKAADTALAFARQVRVPARVAQML